jgi:phenylacetate-CoA ligase
MNIRISPARRALLWFVLTPVSLLLRLVGPHYRAFFWLVTNCPPGVQHAIGRWRAVRAYDHAVRRVPAYRAFVESGNCPGIPVTDKANYVQKFSIVDRCVDGRLPGHGVAIDESSGSTGTPYNWVRSHEERVTSHAFISHFARYCFGDGPWITINAFSMGAWATGLNMGIALQHNSVVKSTGPDIDKVLSTLELFGPERQYLICGYPPFLKHLMDAADERGFGLHRYRLMGLVGGEGMSEGLRDYLSGTFEKVYSGYGATDLEIGIAGETPLAVAVRRAAREDPKLRRVLFGDDSRLPMVFQYNALSHDITVTGDRELVITISRLNLLAPRIAYNVHDEGGVASYPELARLFRQAGRELADILPVGERPPALPFVWVFGRSDSTVSVMGANIYPEDVEQALYSEPGLAAVTSSFCLGLREAKDGSVRPRCAFELRVPVTEALLHAFEDRIVAGLYRLNADFRTAMAEHPASARPVIELHPTGTGPFAADRGRIKQVRLAA